MLDIFLETAGVRYKKRNPKVPVGECLAEGNNEIIRATSVYLAMLVKKLSETVDI